MLARSQAPLPCLPPLHALRRQQQDQGPWREVARADLQDERPIWVLTCYGHERGGPNDLAGGDISPEEVRWANMQAAAAGVPAPQLAANFAAVEAARVQQFGQLVREARPPTRGGTAMPPPPLSIIGLEPAAAAQPAAAGFGQHAAPAAAARGFGQPAAAGFGQPAAAVAGGFGQPAIAGGFGQPAAAGGFGQPAAPIAFGQAAQPAAAGFGQTAAAGFGQPAAVGFGQPVASPGFGQAAAAAPVFGQQPAAPSAAAGGFGQAPSAGMQPAAAAGGFGQPAAPGGFGGAFGAVGAAKPVFGHHKPSSTGFGSTPFGQAAAGGGTLESTPFGQAAAQPAAASSAFGGGGGGFGSAAPPPFGQPTAAAAAAPFGVPSPAAAQQPTAALGAAGDAEAAAWQAASFERGRIPETAPPPVACR